MEKLRLRYFNVLQPTTRGRYRCLGLSSKYFFYIYSLPVSVHLVCYSGTPFYKIHAGKCWNIGEKDNRFYSYVRSSNTLYISCRFWPQSNDQLLNPKGEQELITCSPPWVIPLKFPLCKATKPGAVPETLRHGAIIRYTEHWDFPAPQREAVTVPELVYSLRSSLL